VDDHYTTTDLIDGLHRLHRQAGETHRKLLAYIAACDDAKVWKNDDCRDMAQWLATHHGVSVWKARRMVDAGHVLKELPKISAALCDGTVSLDKVLELCRFATTHTEAGLLPWAIRTSPAGIRARADRERRIDKEDVQDAHRSRFLTHWWYDDGSMLGLEGALPAEKGAIVAKALDRLADQIPVLPEDDTTNFEARRADALVALASTSIARDEDPDRSTVVVHVPVQTLAGGDANGLIENGPAIHPDVARGLCCHARIEIVLEDRDGRPVGVGRASREPPPWLMRLLRNRDGNRCTFPGCGRTALLKAHHIHWWSTGGHTDLENLALMCTSHHALIHVFGWNVRLKDGVEVQWFRPEGKLFVPGPSPPREPMLTGPVY
jgi:hypothetical protein